jgi:hypothetical protein
MHSANRAVMAATLSGLTALSPVHAQPAPQSAPQPSVQAYLDTAPDLAGRWRQINKDPAFLAWLGHPSDKRFDDLDAGLALLRREVAESTDHIIRAIAHARDTH